KNGIQIKSNNIEIVLSNVGIRIIDECKGTSILGQIHSLQSKLNIEGKEVFAANVMDIDMEELGFNKARGVFLKNSHLEGTFEANFKEGILTIQPFDLGINDQHFLFNAEFNVAQTAPSKLVLENHHTEYDKFLPLAPKRIQESLKEYQVTKPFYAKVKIISDFSPGDNPIVDVDLQMDCNDLTVQNMLFEDALLEARYINRLYEDERVLSEGRKNIRFEIKEFESKHRGFHIQTKDALILYSPKTGDYIEVKAKVRGKASGISEWLENDQFFFDKGTFQLDVKVHSHLNDMENIMMKSDAELVLKDLSVIYGPANVSFPFEKLVVSKKAKDGYFSILSSTMGQNNAYQIKGDLKNIPALLIELVGHQVSSKVNLVANRLGWTDFIDLFGAEGYLKNDQPKTDRQKKQSMKATISGIQNSFQPTLAINLDTLSYYDKVYLENFQTGIHFEDNDILVLEKTSFKYAEGKVDFAARLDIGKEGTTPFEFELHTENINLQKLLPSVNYFDIKLLQNLDLDYENIDIDILLKGVVDDVKGLIRNTAIGELTFENKFVKGKVNFHPESKMGGEPVMRTKLNLEGNPHVFNDFFKTEEFFFDKGLFRVQFDYEGEVINFEDLLNKAVASFILEKSEVYYKAADTYFPLTHIYLDLRENKGNFRFFMRSDSLREELQFMGDINNISELVLGNTGKAFHTTAAIYSPKLTWNNFKRFFAPSPTANKTANIPNSSPTEKKGMNINAGMKRAIKGILNTFNPKLHVQIDNFEYSEKFAVQDLKAGVGLVNSNILELYNTGFRFHDGSMHLRGQLDLADSEDTPFSANFDTKDLDVAALLESLDYLSIKALEETENLKGRITMNLDLEGVIGGEKQSLIPEKTKGVLDFELSNVEIKGLKIIDKIAEKIKKKKRFKEVIFAPISNRITINGTSLDIPLMEIQSNALNLFIEGRVSPPDSTNLWISVPVKNIRKPKKDMTIEKQGYNATKNKVFLEVKPNEEGKHKMYFRFKKKKFYEERGIPEQYKKDKRANRKIRKKLKKEKKQQKSEILQK
ncbi:MAG: hypothetical protein AB8B69_10155, partial [Chitinophagales bacterium]